MHNTLKNMDLYNHLWEEKSSSVGGVNNSYISQEQVCFGIAKT